MSFPLESLVDFRIVSRMCESSLFFVEKTNEENINEDVFSGLLNTKTFHVNLIEKTTSKQMFRGIVTAKSSALLRWKYSLVGTLCSFTIVMNLSRIKWGTVRSQAFYSSCSYHRLCVHFTIITSTSTDNANQLMSPEMQRFLESVGSEPTLLKERTSLYHLIVTKTGRYLVCSSSLRLLCPFHEELPASQDLLKQVESSLCNCADIRPHLRVVRHTNSHANMEEIFSRVRRKSRETFTLTTYTELMWQIQLGLRLNTSIDFLVSKSELPQESLEQLESLKADLTSGIALSYSWAQRVGFSTNVAALGEYKFFVRQPMTLPSRMGTLIKPLCLELWIGILTCLIGLSIISKLLKWKSTSLEKEIQVYCRILLEQSVPRRHFENNAKKVIAGNWLLAAIVLCAAYKCRLLSSIVKPEVENPPKTFRELLASPLEYKVFHPGFPNGSNLGESLEKSETRLSESLAKRLEDVRRPEGYVSRGLNGVDLCLESVRTGHHACVGPSFYFPLLYQLMTSTRPDFLLVSEDSILLIVALIPMQRNSPYRHVLDEMMGHLSAGGISTPPRGAWIRIVMEYSSKNLKSSGNKSEDEKSSQRYFVIYFYTLLMGCVVSFVALVVELHSKCLG